MRKKTVVRLSFLSVFLVLDTFLVSGQQDSNIVIACGITDKAKDADGREWEPDTKYVTSSSSTPSQASFQDPSLPSEVPYMSARIFTTDATYKFPVKAGKRYLLRFHFYSASFDSLDPSDAYMNVIARGVSLMKNFSIAETSKALTQAYVVKEYSLAPSNDNFINVTFTPLKEHKGSYAFVNGIELIPIPEIFRSAKMVGFEDAPVDVQTSSLETMYRLNVGGQYISPLNDSMLRTWYDDTPYLYGANAGVPTSANNSGMITYNELPEYIAPQEVYSTARSMGYDGDLNKNYNLTWQFQVDPSFTYLIRLHFCDFQDEKVNQRVFDIYVNNQTAQAAADVIGWSTKSSVPVYKDYAIYIADTAGDEYITVALHPSIQANPPPEFFDAILNGLEIFKMNDPSKNLAGPNPRPSDMLLKAEAEATAKVNSFESFSYSNVQVIGGTAGGAAAFGATAALCIAFYLKKHKKRVHGLESPTNSWLPIYGFTHMNGSKSHDSHHSVSSHLSSEAQGLSRRFSLQEIKHATKNFSESNVIGVGGFGKVYKGVIDKATKVAIKRSNPQSEQGVHEFQTEVEMLSKLRHKHLVSLIGFCEEDNEMCLVYDYMARGTLREHIYKAANPQLPWKQRLEICIGAARGLHYLHTGARYTIIHRDVKTTNILVDENWVAKVSDFGLSLTGPNTEKGHVSTVVKGSFGYLDPEYFRRQQLTEKSDVYSFGVVLFEVLCARPALNPSLPKEQVSLADWAKHCCSKGILENIIDPNIKGKINPECLKRFAETARKCLSDAGVNRPSMGDVLWNLEFALQLQENEAEGSSHSSRETSSDIEEITPSDNNSISLHIDSLIPRSEQETSEGREDDDGSREIFSQIMVLKGR